MHFLYKVICWICSLLLFHLLMNLFKFSFLEFLNILKDHILKFLRYLVFFKEGIKIHDFKWLYKIMLFNRKSEIFALNYLVNYFSKNICVPDSKSKCVYFPLLEYILCTKDKLKKKKCMNNRSSIFEIFYFTNHKFW